MKKVQVKLYPQYHSIVGIITNSSSEIFCSIEVIDEIMEDVSQFLSTVLKRKIEFDKYRDTNCYSFEIEYGDHEKVISDFNNMLKHILDNKFGEGVIKIDFNPEN